MRDALRGLRCVRLGAFCELLDALGHQNIWFTKSICIWNNTNYFKTYLLVKPEWMLPQILYRSSFIQNSWVEVYASN